MTKNIKELFNKVNKLDEIKPVVSLKEIDELEQYFKKNIGKMEHARDLYKMKKFKNTFQRLPALYSEVKKQIENKKGLQPGIAAECDYTQTVADILNLNTFIDVEKYSSDIIPEELRKLMRTNAEGGLAARYLYYAKNKDNTYNAIFQYGNPTGKDISIYYKGELINVEIKDIPALVIDTDLTNDEDGHLIVPENVNDKLKNEVLKFNNKTTIYEIMIVL